MFSHCMLVVSSLRFVFHIRMCAGDDEWLLVCVFVFARERKRGTVNITAIYMSQSMCVYERISCVTEE